MTDANDAATTRSAVSNSIGDKDAPSGAHNTDVIGMMVDLDDTGALSGTGNTTESGNTVFISV